MRSTSASVLPLGLLLAAALLAACAANPAREARARPHHYTTARDGTPLECYPGKVEGEYECLPQRGYYVRDPLYYDPFYDPWWPRLGYFGTINGYYPVYPAPVDPPSRMRPRPVLKDKFPKKP